MPLMTRMGALKIADPEGWKKAIVTAMAKAGGRVDDAARSLEVSSRQLFRWLALDELKGVERVENGLPRDGRRGRRAKEDAPAKKAKRTSVTKIRTRQRKAS